MALHLGQVEVGPTATSQQFLRVVEEVEAEVEDGAGHGLAIDEHVPLFQMPAAGADKEHGDFVVELVLLLRDGVGIGDGAADGVAQIDLAVEQVVPGGSARVLKVGHEDLGAGVERVDDHLAIDGPGNLNAAVQDVGGQRRDRPCGFADISRLGEEIGLLAGIESLLPFVPRGEQLFAARVEGALQIDDEGQCLRRENFGVSYRSPGRELQRRAD